MLFVCCECVADQCAIEQLKMSNPFERVVTPIEINGRTLKYYSLPALEDERLCMLSHPLCDLNTHIIMLR